MSTQSRIQKFFEPVNNLVVLNAETTGTIVKRQSAFVGELVDASVHQVKALAEAGSVRDAFDVQRDYLRDVGSRFQAVTRDNVETLRDAGRSASDVVRGAFRRGQVSTEESLREARAEAAETVAPSGTTVKASPSSSKSSANKGSASAS